MRNYFKICFALIIVTFIACQETDDKNNSIEDNSIQFSIIVYNHLEYNVDQGVFPISEGAQIDIYEDLNSEDDTPVLTITTDSEGIATGKLDSGTYTAIVTYKTQSNLIEPGVLFREENGSVIWDNVTFGFVPEGVFENQEDLAQSHQDDAEIGDLKFPDLNGDGIIDDDDRTIGTNISLQESIEPDLIKIWVGKYRKTLNIQ